MADVPPLPKKKPVLDLKKDLRPISLTRCVSKVAEEFVVEEVVKPAVLGVIHEISVRGDPKVVYHHGLDKHATSLVPWD